MLEKLTAVSKDFSDMASHGRLYSGRRFGRRSDAAWKAWTSSTGTHAVQAVDARIL